MLAHTACLANNVVYNKYKSRLSAAELAQNCRYWAPVKSQAERERQSNPMNRQLFMKREQREKAGGEDALPQWTSVILTSLLLYCHVL